MDDTTTPVVPSDPTQPVPGTDVPAGGPVGVPTPPPAEPVVPVEPTVPPMQEPTVIPNQEPVPPVTPPAGGTDQGGTQGMA